MILLVCFFKGCFLLLENLERNRAKEKEKDSTFICANIEHTQVLWAVTDNLITGLGQKILDCTREENI